MIDGGALGWGDGGRAEPGESERGQKEKDRGNRDRQRRIGEHQLEAVIPRRSHIEIAHQISVSPTRSLSGLPPARRSHRGIDNENPLYGGIDRKSVVEGKGVTVRVRHGGRRIIKKQRKMKYSDKNK